MTGGRAGYDDVVVTTPITVPYVRYSIRGAHWFLAGALAGLLKQSGLRKDRVDGLCVSSFTLTPDSAVGLTQHLGKKRPLPPKHVPNRCLLKPGQWTDLAFMSRNHVSHER